MNKKIVAGAVLAVVSSGVFAQDSITIYGLANAGLTAARGVSDKNGNKHSRIGVDSGLLGNSRIGVKGEEDLGQGTEALFVLEGGINLDDGTSAQGGRLWGRKLIVGLKNNDLGTVTLGRQSSILDSIIGGYDAYGNLRATAASDLIKYDNHIDNSIMYVTPDYHGFYAKAHYGFGEHAGSASEGRFYNVSVNYTDDALSVSLSGAHSDYGDSTDADTSVDTDDAVSFYKKSGLTPTKRDIYFLGQSYDFGVLKQFALLSYGKINFDTSTSAYEDLTDKALVLGVSVPFGASTFLASAGYSHVAPKGGETGNAQQYTVGYTYDWSKRTKLFATYAYMRNSDSLKQQKLAYTTALSATQLFTLGISHRF